MLNGPQPTRSHDGSRSSSLRGEIIGDVECLSDFLGRLALDHVLPGDSLATNIEEGLDVEIVGSLGDTLAKTLEINICGSLTRIISNSIS